MLVYHVGVVVRQGAKVKRALNICCLAVRHMELKFCDDTRLIHSYFLREKSTNASNLKKEKTGAAVIHAVFSK
uniref:Uncharacterized protein n=1 Tax=Romanomermis culicivorax TaxID=13658 RepID=A0A915I6Y2_ROMCU